MPFVSRVSYREPAAANVDLDGVAEPHRQAVVDLDAGDDDRVGRRAAPEEKCDPRLLEVRQVDGVVDVPHRVEVAEADGLAVDEHAAMV